MRQTPGTDPRFILQTWRPIGEFSTLEVFLKEKFFESDFDFDRNDEAVDYFVNIAKSLVLKLDSNSLTEPTRPVPRPR